jgi:hypothetical protein
MEGRALAKRNAEEEAATQAQNWTVASFGLDGVRQRAGAAPRPPGSPTSASAIRSRMCASTPPTQGKSRMR